MKILYLANARIPTEKAHGYQIMKTIEALLQEKQEVTLLVPTRTNPISQSVKDFYNLEKLPNIEYTRNWFGFLEKKLKRIYFSLQRVSYGLQAFWCALFSTHDVIFSREITLCFFLSLFKKNVVFEDHEPKEKWLSVYAFFVRHIPKKIVVAHSLGELYNEYHVSPQSYVEVPNGVEKAKFDTVAVNREVWNTVFQIVPTEKIVLYVGHLYRWKGADTLLASAAMLPQAKVVFIGGHTKDRQKMAEAAKAKNLQNVFFHEFVPHDEIIPFLKSADVLVLPNTATEERSQKYTTPLKLFEYMASQVPMVASRIKSFTPYLKDKENALLFAPDDARDLAEKINIVLQQSDISKHIADNAYALSNEYTWQKRAQKIISFI